MNGWMYAQMMREMTQCRALPRVVVALCIRPMTVKDLRADLGISTAVVKLTLSFLRKLGFRIENRGAKGGCNGRKGTYHLVHEPKGCVIASDVALWVTS